MIPATLTWTGRGLRVLDQRALPESTEYIDCVTVAEVIDAIKTLAVRGAPAIGIAAAYGAVIAAMEDRAGFEQALDALKEARPTAVNLAWAVDRMKALAARMADREDESFAAELLKEARSIHLLDVENNRRMGEFGAALLPEQAVVLTHCNAGALATGGHGTALGILRTARERGKNVSRVYACETRPLLQGARLTAWELAEDGFDVVLICDSMAGSLMKGGKIDAVVVGADRITANGDAANKIGTYALAVLASAHGIPFYVAAPRSTIDAALACGSMIPIEERDGDEVRVLPGGKRVGGDIGVWNPAFDVTPATLITAIITEDGVHRAPYRFSKSRPDDECPGR